MNRVKNKFILCLGFFLASKSFTEAKVIFPQSVVNAIASNVNARVAGVMAMEAVAATPTPAVQVGFGEIAAKLPESIPLGGYGSEKRRLNKPTIGYQYDSVLFKPSLGTLDPIRSKAMLVKNGNKKLLFISLDLVGVTESFRKDFLSRVKKKGYTNDEVFISATHTHSGPGALSKNIFWAAVALDFYQERVYEAMMKAALESLTQAESRLIPAIVSYSSVEVPDIQRNRRGHNGRFDKSARLLWAKTPNNVMLGVLANFAIHGIAYGEDNLFLSADIPGGIEHELKKRITKRNQSKVSEDQLRGKPAPVAVFINGAEGDVSPAHFFDAGIGAIAMTFSNYVMTSIENGKPMPEQWTVEKTTVHFPLAGLSIKNCAPELGFNNRALKWFSRGATIPLIAPFFPVAAELTAVKWGKVGMVTWPGEPTTQLGTELRQVILKKGFEDAMVLGLTNEHLAYFVTPEEFEEGGYESCFTAYGKRGGEKIIDRYRTLFR